MCDERTERDAAHYINEHGKINRRQFTTLLAMGALGSAFPQFAIGDTSVIRQQVQVNTPDGKADCLLVSPAAGKHPAVIMWPDIKGRRDAFDAMGSRLAAEGYAVLVVNPFYRDVQGAALPDGIEFPAPEARAILNPMRAKLVKDAVVSDARAFFSFMDSQAAVDSTKPGAVMGYCMSGAFTMFAAAAMPDRIGAIASYHGGGLATDKDDSPHLTVEASNAVALHAIAENDNERSPDMKPLLIQAYEQAGLSADIAVYPGTLHGWTPPDSTVYNEVQAELAWSKTLTMFRKALI
ncbi:dienelactone hydrolase family protein [Alteromonas sp. AMM-1]|uniref:dienelactone hydrolase family protein n=1 Tax=Alteromonas sp. AMM-1 TaxID=3394233 RepID=UPI0039A69D86